MTILRRILALFGLDIARMARRDERAICATMVEAEGNRYRARGLTGFANDMQTLADRIRRGR